MSPENNSREPHKRILNPDEKKTREKLYVFLICLALSVFIWFLIALSKESFTALNYPVQFVNLPADMVLVNNPDSILTFRIASGGLELFTLRYLTRKQPVEIDVEKIRLKEENGLYSGIYNTDRLAVEIQEKHRFAEELIDISPKEIYFTFEPMTGKEVPVISNLDLDFKKQFRLIDSIVFTPEKVKVVGPRNVVEKVTSVKTTDQLVNGIDGTVTGRCRLEKPFKNEQLTLVPNEVDFSLSAERFTEATLAVPINSTEQDGKIKTFPDKVDVTFLVSLENFKRIDPELFTAVVDLPDSSSTDKKAQVRLSRIPPFVEVVRIEPEGVDFLVITP